MKAFTLIISRMLDVESSRGVEVVKRTEEYRTISIRVAVLDTYALLDRRVALYTVEVCCRR